METSVDQERGFITACLTGPQTFEMLQASFVELTHRPDFDFSLNRLWDVREAGFEGLGTDDIRSIMSFVQSRPEDADTAKVAVLVARDLDPKVSDLFRLMFVGFLPDNIQVFHDPVIAEAWVTKSPS